MSFKERISSVFPVFDDGTRIRIILDALQSEFDDLGSDTEEVQNSLFVETADGQSLDLIGDEFGRIGQRRGRDDQRYRRFLQGLVPIFRGRGTERDVEVAVAAGVVTDPDNVDLRQDFSSNDYEVELFDWSAHRSGVVRDLSQLADPVAVDRVDPVHNFAGGVAVGAASDSTVLIDETVSETATVISAPGGGTKTTVVVGLSADELEPLSTDGFVISTVDRPTATTGVNPAGIEFIDSVTASTVSPRVRSQPVVIRNMTTTGQTTVAVDVSQSQQVTLSERGLSSLQLDGLSTLGHSQLSTV